MALGAVGIAGVAFFIYLSTRLSAPGMTMLYAELTAKDSAQIVAKLESANVPFTLKAGGTQIYVPADGALRVRMSLAQEGLPRGGSVGYEIFDRSEGVGSSSLVQNINRLRALEGELSRTISSMAQVASARVNVVLPQGQLFSREREQPSASIVLKTCRDEQDQRLTDQIKALRRQIASEMGFVMPAVRIQDNMQLPANTYVVRVKDIEAGRGDVRPGMLLVMDPRGEKIALPGEDTTEPTFGLPAMWIDTAHREEAQFKGYTVVEPSTVVTTHLIEVIKDNMTELLSYAETKKLMDELEDGQRKLVEDLVPNQISIGGIQRVLQNLLSERISIRDLPTILEGIADACGHTRNLTLISEHVRMRLARQICEANTGPHGNLAIVQLTPEWEQAFAEAIVGEGDERQLAMSPTKLQEFIVTLNQVMERQAMMGESPVLLTSPMIRPYVRSIVERVRPVTVIMSQNEVHPKARIKTLDTI